MADRRPRHPHEVLGVRPDASSAEISRAYRRLARELHPDSRPAGSDAADRFRAAAAAYELLSDRSRRAADNHREAQDQPTRRRPARMTKPGTSRHEEGSHVRPAATVYISPSLFTPSALVPVRPGPVRVEPLPGSAPAAGEDVMVLLAELLEQIGRQAPGSRDWTW